jgi:hypothetical protein
MTQLIRICSLSPPTRSAYCPFAVIAVNVPPVAVDHVESTAALCSTRICRLGVVPAIWVTSTVKMARSLTRLTWGV